MEYYSPPGKVYLLCWDCGYGVELDFTPIPTATTVQCANYVFACAVEVGVEYSFEDVIPKEVVLKKFNIGPLFFLDDPRDVNP